MKTAFAFVPMSLAIFGALAIVTRAPAQSPAPTPQRQTSSMIVGELPSLRQYLSIRGASGATLSPDGGQTAFLTSITGTAQAWRVSSRGGWPQQLTFFPSGVSSVTWSPASADELLVVRDDNGDEQYQFYLVNANGTRLTALTNDPKVRHGFGGWSRDGKTIFYDSNARDPRFFDCYLMDVASRQSRRVFQKDALLAAEALSPDKKTLAVGEALSNVNNNLYLVNVETGESRMVTSHTGDATYSAIGFSGDGKTLYVRSDEGREFVNLAQIDVASGKLTFLQKSDASDAQYDIENAEMAPDGRRLAYTTNRDGFEALTVWNTESKRALTLPELPEGITTPGGFSGDGKRLAIALNTPTRNGDVHVLDLDARKTTQVTFSATGGIALDSFVAPELIHYKTFDGRDIPAFLYTPPIARRRGLAPIPVILSIHGGPEAQERPSFSSLYQYFVSRGYAVLAPNIRGSAGYGKSYLAMDNGPKRWDALKDLAAATEFVGTRPELDRRKIAVMGGSYGGFATLAMLTHYPDRFAAGIDLFGPADFRTFYANTAAYRRPLRIAEYGDPDTQGEFLDAISPARHLDRVTAPLLVIQGANDPRVPESESRQVAEKIKARGGTVDYLLFPDEGHGIAKLPNRIKAYEAVVAFLDRIFAVGR